MSMPNCDACNQLRRQPSHVAPHSALKPRIAPSLVTNSDTGGTQAQFQCQMCGAVMINDAKNDNSNPIWDLYAG